LYDERAIVRGLNRFARLADTRNWAAVAEVFVSDVRFDYGAGEQQGIEALTALFQRFLARCGPSQHLLGSIEVDVDGDQASSRAYVQARHQGAGDMASRFYDTHGEYRDRWHRTAAGWRITQREVIWQIQRGDPAVLGL
jgi:3-phenylpropionate/cinnamic acid dioxygenase small subunit